MTASPTARLLLVTSLLIPSLALHSVEELWGLLGHQWQLLEHQIEAGADSGHACGKDLDAGDRVILRCRSLSL